MKNKLFKLHVSMDNIFHSENLIMLNRTHRSLSLSQIQKKLRSNTVGKAFVQVEE